MEDGFVTMFIQVWPEDFSSLVIINHSGCSWGWGFKPIEFFWKALLLGGQTSETQMSSQNKFYALVVYSGPLYFNLVVEKHTETTMLQESHKYSMRTEERRMNYD